MKIVNDAISVLEDAKVFLKSIQNDDYSQPIELMSFSTIGMHTRHFIEFFQCLITQECNCNINYADRKRDLRIESDSDFALETIDWIVEKLPTLDLNKDLQLCIENDSRQFVKSNIAREIVYNIEHVIHHLAILKIALKIQCPNLRLPNNFGVAPSTLAHQRKLVAAS